jgi:hypothetical protein
MIRTVRTSQTVWPSAEGLANIRGEPRFKKLMERVKYEWEHFEV